MVKEMKTMRAASAKEGLARALFLITACVSVLAVATICVFLFASGIPGMAQVGVFKFLFGTAWQPSNGAYGILPMILGSIYVTAGALVFGVPAGVITAVFLSRFAPKKLAAALRPLVSLMAGIPSVVYGFFGLVVLAPVIRSIFGGRGTSLLAASLLLGMMILPTVITLAKSALDAAPESYYEGALALGASHERAVFSVVLPAAKSGVGAGIVLGVGRAIGEAMAVMMVAGNQPAMPQGILKGVRTLTANIVMEMGYASGLHAQTLISTGVVLFVFILIINFTFALLKRKGAGKER